MKLSWPRDRKKAFLWAAEAFGTPENERTEWQEDLTSMGICWTIRRLTHSTKIYRWADDFRREIGIENDTWWPERFSRDNWTPSCDKERSLFCCLMAQLSDQEFEEISG